MIGKRRNKLASFFKRIAIILCVNMVIVLGICYLAGDLTLDFITKGLLYSAVIMVILALWAFTSSGEMYIGRAHTRYISTAGYSKQDDRELRKEMAGEGEGRGTFGLTMLICAGITAMIGIL